jgi:arginyl-tRNA synthetase
MAETKKRHVDWSEEKINEISKRIFIAGLKFGILKNGNDKVITFDLEEALDPQGFSGPYLQYTLARINSIYKKAGAYNQKLIKPDYKNLGSNIEKALIKNLVRYPEVAGQVIKSNDSLAQDFNAFYHELPVLKADPEIKIVRLQLIGAIKQVLTNGLGLLGIPTLEEM